MKEDIYTVSIPLTLGVLCSFLLGGSVFGSDALHYYCIASVAAPAVMLLLGVSRRRRTHCLWVGVFFLLGVLLHSLGSINEVWDKALTQPKGPFGAMQDALSLRIDAIPLRDAENNALMKALLLGRSKALSDATVSAFRTAGAAHLLALSGMHLGIIYGAVGAVLRLTLGNSLPMRIAREVAVTLICLWYTLVCGAGQSLLRAWLFIALREISLLLDRPQRPQQILCSALTLHLVIRPTAIAGIGFQLSYLAMVGIVFVWPRCKDWVDSRLWQAASLSICCQLFTAPLTLLYFGTFPKYFLITNMVASPLLTVALLCCVVLLAVGAPGGFAAPGALTLLCEFPLTLLRQLLLTISSLP